MVDSGLNDNAAVIGLGKVGICLAASLASVAPRVHGYDIDPDRCALLSPAAEDAAPLDFEAGLFDRLSARRDKLVLSGSIGAAIRSSAISFVILPTPSKPDGSFSNQFLEAAFTEIGAAIKSIEHHHIVVLVSTVSPGSVNGRLRDILETCSGKICGDGFGLVYSPALIALGNVIKGFEEPDFAFIGEVDAGSADRLEQFYRHFLKDGTPLHRMAAESAEIAKIALNNFLTMKITFANLIGHLSGRVDGANAQEVLGAIGADHRVGKAFLSAGMGFGGPCLPRDNAALSAALATVDLPRSLPDDIKAHNHAHNKLIAKEAGLTPTDYVAVLGLGYKAGSPITLDSAAIDLCNSLAETGYAAVIAIDAQASEMDLDSLHASVKVVDVAERDELASVDVLFVTTKDTRNSDLLTRINANRVIQLG